MRGRRVPNTALKALMREAGLSGSELTRAVNKVGAEAGFALNYQRASASQWLAGTQPRAPTIAFLLEVLSRRLGRTIGVHEAGFGRRLQRGEPRRGTDLWGTGASEAITQASALVDRPFTVSESTTWRIPPRGSIDFDRINESPERVASADAHGTIAEAALITEAFSRVALQIGGGAICNAVAAYLASAAQRVFGSQRLASGRGEALTVLAQLAYLSGVAYADELLNGRAQRYLRLSARLADEAEDAETYTASLMNLSVQAYDLEHYETSAELLSRAREGGWAEASPGLRAAICGRQAVLEAASGHRVEAEGLIRQAEVILAETSRRLPNHSSLIAAHHYHRALVYTHRSEDSQAIQSLEASLKACPRTDRKAWAVLSAHTAERCMTLGEIGRAVMHWSNFLGAYPTLCSGLADKAFAEMRSRLHTTSSDARLVRLDTRARALAAARHASAKPLICY